MKKLFVWLDNNILKILVGFLLAFIVLYPKLPSIGIPHTWVYVRLEDFFIALTVIVWFTQALRKKITLPFPLGLSVVVYWVIGFVSLVYCLLFIAPSLANFFPTVAVLEYLRRIEYMILFFIGFTTIRSTKDVQAYLITLGLTLAAIVGYGLGQRNYVFLWHLFPSFFTKYPFCFPAFLTGNEEFAKGTPFCLAETSRVAATFGGHYDLAAYLVLVIPVFIGVFVAVKKWYIRVLSLLLVTGSLILLNFTSSRTSYAAYLFGAVAALMFWKKKWWILPVMVLSIGVLLVFKGDTLARFLKTIQPVNVVSVQPNEQLPADLQKIIKKTKEEQENQTPEKPPPGTITVSSPINKQPPASTGTVTTVLTDKELASLSNINIEGSISTRSGAFLVQKAYALDISFTTRFQAEWPRDFTAFTTYPMLGQGYSSLTLASDNDYLRSLGETGVLGFVAFFLIFVVLGIYLRSGAWDISLTSQAFVFGLAGGTVGLLANALLIDVFEASKVGESFWLLAGIGVGAIAIQAHTKVNFLQELRKLFTSSFFLATYLLIATFVFFGDILTNFFVADDFTWLKWAATASLQHIPTYFLNAEGFFYRPLDKIIMFFLYTFFSFQPVGYHIFSLLLYFSTAIGVYALSLHIFKTKEYSFLTAMLFLLLPMHFENVLWISTLSINLCALCIVWGSVAWLHYREKASPISYGAVVLLSLLSVFSYELGVVYPLALLSLDMVLLGRRFSKKDILLYLPLLLVDCLYGVLRALAHVAPVGGDYSYSIAHLIPNVVGNMVGYVGLFVFGPLALPWYSMLRADSRPYSIGIIIAVLLFLALVGIYLLKKRPLLYVSSWREIGWSFAWIIVTLLPFVALGNISPRYGYVASIGYVIVVGVVCKYLAQKAALLSLYAKKLFPVVFFVLLFGVSLVQFGAEEKAWLAASTTTRNTFSFFLTEHPILAPRTQLIFVNVPIRKADTWIFPVGLSDAVWFIYHDSTIQVYQVASVKKAVQLKESLTSSGKQALVFSYNHDGVISEIKTK